MKIQTANDFLIETYGPGRGIGPQFAYRVVKAPAGDGGFTISVSCASAGHPGSVTDRQAQANAHYAAFYIATGQMPEGAPHT
jgi:hypothetical protein